MNEKCELHSGIETQMLEHERRLNDNDGVVKAIYQKMDSIEKTIGEKIETITNKLLGRPGWGVTITISLLMFIIGIFGTVIGFLSKK